MLFGRKWPKKEKDLAFTKSSDLEEDELEGDLVIDESNE
jgi:hypothetical protein